MDLPTELFLRYQRRGEVEALGRLFDLVGPQLYGVALHACGNAADAEDALQATFVVAMRKAAGFDPTQPVGPWLGGILAGEASNLRRRERRRRGADVALDLVPATADPAATIERRELLAELRQHIERLAPEQRQVLLLQLQHGLAPAEIAEVVGAAPGTVRMRLHRGLQALRALLPAGLASALGPLLPARGMAQVRVAVMKTAGASAVAGVVFGGLMMKKLVGVLIVALCVCLGGWWALAPFVERGSGAAAPVPVPVPVAEHGSTDRAAESKSAAAMASAVERLAAVSASAGSLRVRVAGVVFQRERRGVSSASSMGGGPALADIGVQVRRIGSLEQPQSLRTDVAGEAIWPALAVGTWRVAVTTLGFEPERDVEVVAGESAFVEIHTGAVPIDGRVLDARGIPVAEAEVLAATARQAAAGLPAVDASGVIISGQPKLIGAFGEHAHVRLVTRTAADGSFQAMLLQGEAFLGARKLGHAASPSLLIAESPDVRVELMAGHLTLVLGDAPGSVVARIQQLDRDGFGQLAMLLQPANGAWEWAANGERLGPALPVSMQRRGSDEFVADGLRPGPYLVSTRRFGHWTTALLKVRAGQCTHFTQEVRPIVVLDGLVVDARGRALSGVTVAFYAGEPIGDPEGTLHTDANGRFRELRETDRAYTLVAYRDANGPRVSKSVPGQAAGIVAVELVLDEPPPLLGRVIDADGNGVYCQVAAHSGDGVRWASTGDHGKFEFPAMVGDVCLRVHRQRDEPPIEGVEADRVGGSTQPVVLQLPPRPPTATVSGRVVDPQGQPLPDATVDWEHGFGDTPAEDGTFTLHGLTAGRHQIQFSAPARAWHQVSVDVPAAGELSLGDIVLAPEAVLRLRILRPDGTPWLHRPPVPTLHRDGDQHALPPSQLDVVAGDGFVQCLGLAAGRYQLTLHQELLVPALAVELRAGDIVEQTIATRLARRRLLVFAGDPVDGDAPLLVEVHGADGVRLWRGNAWYEGGETVCSCPVPVGLCVVQAGRNGAITHQMELTTAADEQWRIVIGRR